MSSTPTSPTSAPAKSTRCGCAIAVLQVHRLARRCDAVDSVSCLRIGSHEALEIRFPEHQEPAIGQCRYVSLTRPTRKQSHCPEELTGAEPHRPRGQRYFDRS